MGTKYDQLSLEERCDVAALHSSGCSIRQIAAALDRSASSISRELKRNWGQQIGYKPVHAQERAKARRWKGSKLERNGALREEVLACLREGWSPEQACGWIERQHGCKLISTETIYRFIYDQIARHKDYSWRHYLPRAKARRWKGSKLERNGALREEVLACLREGWSPEQACGWIERQHGCKLISTETIYRFIYDQIARHKDYSWRHYLPRAKAKRGWRGRKGGSSALHIHNRIPITERP